jgi:hypothetical protein
MLKSLLTLLALAAAPLWNGVEASQAQDGEEVQANRGAL